MYLDFEDYRPDTPRVPSAISVREGVLLSLVFHLVILVVILLTPSGFFVSTPVEAVVLPPQEEPIRFVHMEPLVDRIAPPRPQAEMSDLDRRSSTRVRPPDAVEPLPFSRGNTPEKVEGAPEERARGPESTTPSPPSPSGARPDTGFGETPIPVTPPAPPAAGRLGQSLRDLQRYLQDQNFESQKGGLIDNGPDIQFDSKGVEFGPWLRRFVAQVKGNWFIPQAAMIQKGRVVLQFYVHRNGQISDLTIVGPSGIEAFNLSSFNALKLSNPTQPLPPEYPLDKAFFTVTFHYNVDR